jgi:hypothetical protein
LDRRATAFPDRRLGRSWYDWDGTVSPRETALSEGPALYFLLVFVTFVVASLLLVLGVWLLSRPSVPRHAEFLAYPLALLLAALALLWAVVILSMTAVAARNRALAFPWLSKSLTFLVPGLVFLFRPLGLSRDRISSSCIAITNALSRLRLREGDARRPMLLLPRCLTRESVAEIKRTAASFDCPVFLIGSNEQARSKVREFQPTSVIAVACERDLVRGLYDFGRRIPILVIANQRPKGPCLDAVIDFDQLRRALQDLVRREQDHSTTSEAASNAGAASLRDRVGT